MPHDIPWEVRTSNHPGSSAEEIEREPDWHQGHNHRIGLKNKHNRRPGLTHDGDEFLDPSEAALIKEAKEGREKLRKAGLVNFRDIVQDQPDFHLRRPENRSIGWRYVLDYSEEWVRNTEEWPANVQRKQKEEASQQKQEKQKNGQQTDGQQKGDGPDGSKKSDSKTPSGSGQSKGNSKDDHDEQSANPEGESKSKDKQPQSQEENDWKRKQGENSKHHDAYASQDKGGDDHESSEYERLLERYSPQEIALLRCLQHENEYRSSLQLNDGKQKSPQAHNRTTIAIDEQDQFCPDNWLPRSDQLIRLTGKHPLNAEAVLTTLFEGGLITPNELHYVRNHGAVPRILWEMHKLDVNNSHLVLSMDDLKEKFDSINIPVALACDGNRRKELNMIKRSKGFNWGAGATGCVYWKGPLLRDVLLAAGVKESRYTGDVKQRWVNFQGADEPSEGKYETCIPLDYAMDPTNDVLLAYEMNNVPLPPDHGYPVRLMIPGYVGGRCVKWLSKIWITEHENTSHYHIWDNRVLPSFITEKDGEFATTMFNHPDTACNEQNLNSVIVRPAQGEKIALNDVKKSSTYRIEGYAYDGGGHEVQRVEISLDGGDTWLYCIRKFPDYPIRHGNKFWTWLHWHVDVSTVHLLQCKNIAVRAWNVFKNTQPERPSWNTMGMMNNCWYQVKPQIVSSADDKGPTIVFRHPCEPGTGDGGWMKPSVENQIASVKKAAGTPQKQFTRDEIERHDTDDDCWIVVDGKVYDATSVLAWHPGGKAAITGHAGKVHQETSDEFASIHDDFAYQKLKECVIGVVTDKAMKYIKTNAEAAAKEKAKSQHVGANVVLQKHKWVPITLKQRKELSKDTRRYTFDLPAGQKDLGLGTCQHVQIGFHMRDKMLIRSYTPTRPLLPNPESQTNGHDKGSQSGNVSGEVESFQDGQGTLELVVKTYFPDPDQPGGAMSNILDCVPIGEEIEIRGPVGDIEYLGQGKFTIDGEDRRFKKISLVLGGSGITPGYALIVRSVLEAEDDVEIRAVDANKSEQDILLKDELKHFEEMSRGRLKITHVLSHPSDSWDGQKGHVNADIIKNSLFPPGKDSVVFLCGPPAMIQKAALPALKDWGYVEDENVFGF